MAQLKETLEPYVKVQEVVKTRTTTPTAGEDLIIGCALVSDSGPSVPVLIQSQEEFVKTFSIKNNAQELDQSYIDNLDSLYEDGRNNTASCMWQNAYRLSGSNNLLVCRASKANNVVYTKALSNTGDEYVLRDGELLKRVTGFCLCISPNVEGSNSKIDGFSINVNGIGILGNLRTDNGAQYDYYCDGLAELVEELNNTSKFFSPNYVMYSEYTCEPEYEVESKDNLVAIEFKEVYIAPDFLDKTDERCSEGIQQLCFYDKAEKDSINEKGPQPSAFVNLNSISNYTIPDYFVSNTFNTASNLKVRIRRFNHDAVLEKDVAEISEITAGGQSPWGVLETTLDTFTSSGNHEPAKSITDRDFFEVAVQEGDQVAFYNIGNISGRGDISIRDLEGFLDNISIAFPKDLHDLGLNYYGYKSDDYQWVALSWGPKYVSGYGFVKGTPGSDNSIISTEEAKDLTLSEDAVGKFIKVDEGTYYQITTANLNTALSYSDLYTKKKEEGLIAAVTAGDNVGYYIYTKNSSTNSIYVDLKIDTAKTNIICVGKKELMKALDQIELNEVYTVEGLSDLGYTDLEYQKYVASKAIASNYFYPISTINSTNYMTIGNSITKLSSFDSMKLYASAPWDIDTETFGWETYISPSVIYWEAVARNRSRNQEFHGILGQSYGVVNYQNPVCEFNKKTRQLLLSKRINTVLWNTQTSEWNYNDNYTKQVADTIMSDEGNSRLMIRISKAVPSILKPFIGEKISEKLCSDIHDAIDYFFKKIIMPMGSSVDAYQIFCEYDETLAAQNKVKVIINARYQRSLKYICVVNNAYDVGMDISNGEE